MVSGFPVSQVGSQTPDTGIELLAQVPPEEGGLFAAPTPPSGIWVQ